MDTLVSVFHRTAARRPDAPALVTATETVTFGALAHRAERFAAHAASCGIGKGDRVLVAMGVSADLYAALAGLWRLGAVVVFPEPAMGLAGLAHAVRTTRPKAFIAKGGYCWLKLHPELWRVPLIRVRAGKGPAPEAAITSDDPALISFTSGSTGAPKGISRSHGFLMAQHRAVLPLLGEETRHRDLVGFPVFVLVNLAVGRCSVLPNWPLSRQDGVTGTDLSNWIEQTGATRALLPPSLATALSRDALPEGLETLFTGGGPVTPRLVDQLRLKAPSLRVVSVYGSTEAEPIAELDWAGFSDDDRAAVAAGKGLLVGHPAPETHIQIVDDEILVAGPHVNESYLDPVQNAETKVVAVGLVWHRTGDAGRLDAAGRLWLLGRHSAIVEARGQKIFPFAVELVAETWPGVRRAALADTREGPVLALETTQGAASLEQKAVTELGIDAVRIVDALPLDRRHRSKIDYPALRQMLDGRQT